MYSVNPPLLRALSVLLGRAAVFSVLSGSLAASPDFVREGTAGFVFSDFAYVLGPDATDTSCPSGLSRNVVEIYTAKTGASQRAGESEEAFDRRLQASAKPLSTSADGRDLCLHPEAGKPDPYFKTVQGSALSVKGIDLDGKHGPEDFENGVDNQFYRVVGCTRSYQSSGQSNSFAIEMLTGAWGMVVELSGLDDIQNDDEVMVTIAANADPIQLSAAREPLPYATYAKDQDSRFRAETKGKLENGVLTTEPVDVRFHSFTNSMRLERPLAQARIQARLSPDGSLEGVLAGYTPVEDFYNFAFGFRNGRSVSGELSHLRAPSANGAAYVLGYTCNGVYHALHEHADAVLANGQPAISTQYRFSAIPAFVVDVETESINAGLTPAGGMNGEY